MNKLSKSFKDEFNNIKINPKDDNRIYESIVNKKHSKHIILKLSTAVAVVLVFVFVGIANADTIKEKIKNSWIKHIFVENEDGTQDERLILQPESNYIDINYDADYDEMNEEIFNETCSRKIRQLDPFYDIEIYEDPCFQFDSFEEFEENLGIRFIRSNMFKKEKLVIKELEKKDNKISRIHFEITNINGYAPKNYIPGKVWSSNKPHLIIDMDVYINTKYYEYKEKEEPPNDNSNPGFSTKNNAVVDYYIKSLDTHAFIMDTYRMMTNQTGIKYNQNMANIRVSLGKNGVSYTFRIRSFKQDKDIIEIVKEFLDTLYLEDN
jgi:hypothetical protein